MKKITLIISTIALTTLVSCSKEENCTEAWNKYHSEVVNTYGLNTQKLSIINQKYNKAYPTCGFPTK